ncbi:H-NS family histone-like protein [Testudinibacter sp. P80/BLE/0925]|uniref:H-NS family histone-like protein n=1 Tax=Testudinibacter sp. TW-1 TaxID=3417757 RepID=UPI003D363C21
MSDLIKKLSNLRSVRVLAKDLSLAQLEDIAEKFSAVIVEKKEELLQIEQQEAERQEKVAALKEQFEKSGLSKEELAALLFSNTVATERKKRSPRPAKYQYTDEKGQVKTWTGQGRTPKSIQDALDSGKSLDDFKI